MSTPNLPKNDTELLSRIQADYSTNANFHGLLRLRYLELQRVIGDLIHLNRMSILDIGCGSMTSLDARQSGNRMYEPWFARIAHEAGAVTTGIDAGYLANEKFTGIQADLSQPGAFKQLGDEEFDMVTTDGFVDVRDGKVTSFTLLQTHTAQAIQKIHDEMMAETERMLKEGGVYLLNRHILVKEQGKLIDKGRTVQYKP